MVGCVPDTENNPHKPNEIVVNVTILPIKKLDISEGK